MKSKICRFILCVVLCASFIGCAVNPLTGNKEFIIMPISQDVEIGKAYAPKMQEQSGGKIEDEILQTYIDSIGQKLAKLCQRNELEYHFTAVNDKAINAFALPGGYIFITKGMLEHLTSEAQMASILAHEIAHVVARDSAAAMSRQIGIDLVLSSISKKTPEAAMAVANISRQLMGLKFSRTDETQADLGGLDYLVAAGYNPYEMVEAMKMLQSQDKATQPAFLSTHPAPANRVEYITEKIQRKYSNAGIGKIGVQEYQQNVLSRLK